MVKLIDYRRDEAALEQSANPFAAVILAQPKVLETRDTPATRWQWKLRLVKSLYDRGLKRQQVRQLFRVLDWMLALPPELEQSFRTDLERFEESRRMPYVTSIERLAREEGYREGLREGIEKAIEKAIEAGRREGIAEGFQAAILQLLERRFKKVAAKHVRLVRSVHNVERLTALLRAAVEANTLDEALSSLRGD
jgi:flagellar biosynthesis/type III secretory pathway protein FliH